MHISEPEEIHYCPFCRGQILEKYGEEQVVRCLKCDHHFRVVDECNNSIKATIHKSEQVKRVWGPERGNNE